VFKLATGEIGTNTLSIRLELDSNNAALSTTRLRQTTPGGNTTYGGEISMKAGIRAGSTAFDRATELSVTAITTDGTASASYETKTQRYDGTNYAATVSGDQLGQFTFVGNYGTSTSPLSVNAAGALRVVAAEDFTATESGASIRLSVNKIGTNTGVDIINASSASAVLRSDEFIFEDSAGAALNGNKIDYSRVYGQFQYDTTVTAVAADTAYVFPLGTADINNIATVGSTSRLIAGAAGIYNLQFSVQVDNADNSNDHDAYIWLRKNGADVVGSMGRTTVTKNNAGSLKIIAWNYIVSSANATDYWEIAYAVSDTDVTFPAFASTAFGPSTACIITSLTPVGA
jgi:hypothetical protein